MIIKTSGSAASDRICGVDALKVDAPHARILILMCQIIPIQEVLEVGCVSAN